MGQKLVESAHTRAIRSKLRLNAAYSSRTRQTSSKRRILKRNTSKHETLSQPTIYSIQPL